MRIAAVVILYHPADEVITNIQSYASYVETLYVFDNTEKTASDLREKLSHLPNARFFHNGRNDGIAKVLNIAAKMAIADGFDWLLTMDQDSSFNQEAIRYYFNCFQNFGNKATTAFIGPAFGRENMPSTPECAPEEVEDTITSGALLNLSLFNAIGEFDENLFIDFVDTEYCVRAAMAGYKTVQLKNIYLQHTLGVYVKRASLKTLFLIKKEKLVHAPIRCYYSYRNMLYIEDKYKTSNPEFSVRLRPYVIGYIKKNIFYGRDALKVISLTRQAIRDFRNGKMGKKED